MTEDRAQAIDEAIRDAIKNYRNCSEGWLRAAGQSAEADIPALQRRFYKMLSERTVILGPGLVPELVE